MLSKTLPRFLISAMVAALVATMSLLAIPFEPAQSAPPPPEPTPLRRPLPPNEPARGMIYDGLEYGTDRLCQGAFKLRDSNHCTHGPDPAPRGADMRIPVAPLVLNTPATVSGIQCDGDGSSGFRTQVMYARASDRADQYTTYLGSIKQWAADADKIYQDSAAETGGYRRLRFVHDAGCNLIVLNVVLSTTGDDNFNNTVNELVTLGYNSTFRKYMIFMDATNQGICGIAGIRNSTTPLQSNSNNNGQSYARVDNNGGCWSGPTIAHESMHNMGGVQRNAPHSTYPQNVASGNTWHCSDEWDVMCYSDATGVMMDYTACPSSSHANLFDCNHDDYYHTYPASGSYLATFWNTANNRFLLASLPTGLTLTPRVFLPFVIR